MLRRALLTAILLAACVEPRGSMPDDGPTDDGPDGGPDGGTGSGSGAAMDGIDPSPPDVTLEWMVVALSVVVVGGSIRSRRRDRKTYEM